MKAININLLTKVTLSVLLSVLVIPVNAEDINAEFKEAFRQELIQEIRKNNIELLDLEKQRIEVRVEQEEQNAEKKSVSYLSILGLIISDALGESELDRQAFANNEAGKINY